MIRNRFVLLALILPAAGALPLGAQAPATASEALLAALEALEDRLPAGPIGVLSPDPEVHSLLPELEMRWPRLRVIEAQVPMSEVQRYAVDLRSMTSGRGTFEVRFDHYEEVPHQEAQRVVEAARKRE